MRKMLGIMVSISRYRLPPAQTHRTATGRFSMNRSSLAHMRRKSTGKRSTTRLAESPRCRVTYTAMAFRALISP